LIWTNAPEGMEPTPARVRLEAPMFHCDTCGWDGSELVLSDEPA
jgi:hypothetical protein